MTTPVTIQGGKMYGHRARIGYTSPPLTTEIFPYEFYKIVPDGVTLAVTSLAIVVRSKDEVDQSYDISMHRRMDDEARGVHRVWRILDDVAITVDLDEVGGGDLLEQNAVRIDRPGSLE